MRGRVLTALLSFAIAALPMAPAIHVHRAQGIDGHNHVVAHTHSEGHHRHNADAGNHDGAKIDDDDRVLIAFDAVLAVPHEHLVVTPALSRALLMDVPPVVRGHSAEFVERLIHGPPRSSSYLRGPPVPTLL